MKRSIVARGRLSDPRHIELAEPVGEIRGDVEVLIRELPKAGAEDVFDVIASLAPGSRTKADIDQQIHEERASWGDR
jgi:sirohydrochlorin ferrochelatase